MKGRKDKINWKNYFFIFEDLGNIVEADGLGDFNLKNLIKGFLKNKTEDEIENIFIVGTKKTTPSISDLKIKYPEPWLFVRLMIGSLIIFYGFVFAFNKFEESNLIPAIIFSGSFAVPISTIFLFFEINIRRNIPIWHVMKLVLTGGLLSIFITLVLSQNSLILNGPSGAWFASFLEEPAKLIAVIILVRNKQKYRYILNGLLFGAAVGCGFAAFESAGYALNYGMNDIDSLVDLIQLRGILSPMGHIAWTAIASASFWRVLNGDKFSYKIFLNRKFYIPFSIVVFIHAIWNSNTYIPFQGTCIILGLVSWTIILNIINLGIKEISAEKSRISNF